MRGHISPIIVIALCTLAAWALTARAQDVQTLRLRGGDTLTGQVIAQSESSITLRHDVLGELTLPRSALAEGPMAQTAFGNRKHPNGSPHAAADPDTPGTPEAPDTPGTPATALRPGSSWSPTPEGWTAGLEVGVNGASGNSESTNLRVAFRAGNETPDERFSFRGHYYLSVEEGQRSRHQGLVEFTQDWLLTDSDWFVFARLGYDFDEQRTIRNRVSGFLGVGYTWFNTPRFELETRMAGGFSREWGGGDEFMPEGLFSGQVIRYRIDDIHTLAGGVSYYPDLEDLNEFRLVSSAEWVMLIDASRGMSFKLGVESEYRSEPRNSDAEHDLKYFGAIVLDF